jgi:erythritol/L-threitol dehydrogenase
MCPVGSPPHTYEKKTMAASALAVECHGPRDYRVNRSRPRPQCGPNELILRVSACGICASDCKCFAGAAMFWGDSPWVKAPVVPGHEFYGVVEELGEGAVEHFSSGKEISLLQKGARVIAEQIVPCGRCAYVHPHRRLPDPFFFARCRFCRRGTHWMCEIHHIFGFQKDVADGGMCALMRLPSRAIIHVLPETLSHYDCAIIEPLACAVHAVRRADPQLEDVVVLAGAGPIGLLMIQVLKLRTPRKIVVIDLSPSRLDLALRFGADRVINPSEVNNAREEIDALTEGYGCDVYIEATGNPAGVSQGLNLVRKLGRFVEFSVFGAPAAVDWSIIGDRKELDIRGAHLGGQTGYEVAIDLLERKLVTSKGIVTHELGLELFDEAMELASGMDSVKVLLNPSLGAERRRVDENGESTPVESPFQQ